MWTFRELLTFTKFPQEIKFIVSIKILIFYSFNFLFFINFNFVNGRIKKFLCSFVKIFQIYFLFLIIIIINLFDLSLHSNRVVARILG